MAQHFLKQIQIEWKSAMNLSKVTTEDRKHIFFEPKKQKDFLRHSVYMGKCFYCRNIKNS